MTQYEKDLRLVKHDGFALEYIKKQTPELCLAAVKESGNALQFVKKQTQKVCLAAVQQNGWALKYVKKQTLKICLEAVKQKSSALQHVKDQTPELFDRMLEENISIEEKYIKIPVETLSAKVQSYLKAQLYLKGENNECYY